MKVVNVFAFAIGCTIYGGLMFLLGDMHGRHSLEAVLQRNHEFMKWACEGVEEGIRRLEETDAKR